MPWRATAPHHGFSTMQPWLPFGPNHAAMAVDTQNSDPESLLNTTRAMIALRKSSEALRRGRFQTLSTTDTLLVFERVIGAERMLCAFNMSVEAADWAPPTDSEWTIVRTLNGGTLVHLPPFACVFALPGGPPV